MPCPGRMWTLSKRVRSSNVPLSFRAKRGICFFLFSAALLAAPAADIGRTTRVIRRADVLRGKSTIALKEQDGVAENDRIRTQSSGRVRAVLNDGSILNIGSSSLLTVRGAGETSRAGSLELSYGRLRAVVSAQAGKSFEVRTKTAVCGVLGTTLFIDSSQDLTRVANLSPEPGARVRVISTNPAVRGEVVLLPGQGTSVPAQGPPQPPRRWTLEEVQAANQDTQIP